jgi:hypothetical protein
MVGGGGGVTRAAGKDAHALASGVASAMAVRVEWQRQKGERRGWD